MTSDDLLRYNCQTSLPGFGKIMQEKLQNTRVLIIGMGGLGCPAAQYLAAAGIGVLGLVDDDWISISNLHRQILYNPNEAGRKKCMVAATKLQAQNPGIQIIPIDLKVQAKNIMDLLKQYDIIVDCSDNFETRYLVNDACVLSGKPLVYGAIYQYEGQVAVWNVIGESGSYSPNYRDLFPEINSAAIPNCSEGGVIPTLAGIIGCLQANEVIKLITGSGEPLVGKLLILNLLDLQTRVIKLGCNSHSRIKQPELLKTLPFITVNELKLKMTTEQVELVDVRSEEEHKQFNIGGRNIPLKQLEEKFAEIKDREVIFYCASGKRSAEAVQLVHRKFPGSCVCTLEGGVSNWLV